MRPTAADDTVTNPPEADPGQAVEPDRLANLVADAAGGDESAWESIVVLYSRRIYAMAKSRLRDAESAEEITQSVFASLAERLRGPGGYTEQGRFEPWLFRIAMNRVRDEGRRRQRRGRDTVSLDAPNTDAALAPAPTSTSGADDLAALRAAVATLDGPDREIIELRHHGNLSFAQIAETLGEPMGTVLARHHRALKKLKKELETPRPAGAETPESPA